MRKLVLLLALALAALAVAAAPAFATTVTPTGALTATTTAAVLTTDGGSLTCDSHATGTVDTPGGAGTLNTLTFTNCVTTFGASCAVTVDTGLSSTASADWVADDASPSGRTRDATLTIDNRITATIDCPFSSNDCTVGAKGATGEVTDGPSQDPATVRFDVNLKVNAGSADNCTNPNWTAKYDLNIAGNTAPTIDA